MYLTIPSSNCSAEIVSKLNRAKNEYRSILKPRQFECTYDIDI